MFKSLLTVKTFVFYVFVLFWHISTSSKISVSKELGYIDLRSDTVTRPTGKMREAMSNAIVGDDVFNADPTVIKLEERIALLLNKEASLFVPSGTMSNLIATMVWCDKRGSEMILGDQSHIHIYEQGGSAQIAGVSQRTLPNLIDGTIDLNLIEQAIRPSNIHFPTTELIAIENTHNMCGE